MRLNHFNLSNALRLQYLLYYTPYIYIYMVPQPMIIPQDTGMPQEALYLPAVSQFSTDGRQI